MHQPTDTHLKQGALTVLLNEETEAQGDESIFPRVGGEDNLESRMSGSRTHVS